MYYFVDGTRPGAGGRLTLKRCDLETFGRETLAVIEGNLPGTSHGISRVYPLSSISSDGRRLCTSGYFGDGKTKQAPWGVIVFDLETGAVRVACEGTELCNAHPQYSRSKEEGASHDVLVQENHGCEVDEFGRVVKLVGGAGADIHAVRDDGTKWRDFPWGRDGVEFCQGHQCWRGDLTSAVTSLIIDPKSEECATRGPAPMVESRAHLADRAKGESHLGRTGKGRRNEITRKIPNANFCHFAFSGDGTRMTSDTCEFGSVDPRESTKLYIGTLPLGRISILRVKYLLHARTSFARNQYRHPHPFLSPDAARLFFNSDEGGQAQIWMAEGFEYP
jgi:hypothetical protein